MISVEQIRAGRALLGWTQKQLASAAGLSVRALNMIELEQVVPREDTLRQIRSALNAEQVAFGSDHGVKLMKDRLEISNLEGPSSKEALMKDIVAQLRWRGGSSCYVGPFEEEFAKINRSLLNNFYHQCAEYNIREMNIVERGYIRFVARPKFYRWLEREQLGEMAFCVYHDTVALFTGTKGDQIVLIHNKGIAAYFMRQHRALWQRAKQLPFVARLKEFEGGVWTTERAEAAWQAVRKMGY